VVLAAGIILLVIVLIAPADSSLHNLPQYITEEVESRSVPLYAYDNDRFATHADGTITYRDHDYTVYQGIDVSSHNGEINWPEVVSGGIDYAIIRVGWRGSSEGTVNVDTAAQYNLENAIRCGMQVGVYFYSQAITPEEAVEEAQTALQVIQDYDITLPVFFDWELTPDEDARTSNPDGKVLTECAVAFCETIEAAGYEAGVYFYPSLGLDTYRLSDLASYHLWLSQPGDVPNFKYNVEMWQYSCSGTVSGVSTICDRNLWFVSNEEQAAAADEIQETDEV
jgi:GH25 family lysozyme M1 (1,4-beta-N-acetylmuramidase)